MLQLDMKKEVILIAIRWLLSLAINIPALTMTSTSVVVAEEAAVSFSRKTRRSNASAVKLMYQLR